MHIYTYVYIYICIYIYTYYKYDSIIYWIPQTSLFRKLFLESCAPTTSSLAAGGVRHDLGKAPVARATSQLRQDD